LAYKGVGAQTPSDDEKIFQYKNDEAMSRILYKAYIYIFLLYDE